MTDFTVLAAPGVQQLNPYLPGKPADELARELGLNQIVKLASNENPLGIPTSAIQAIQQQTAELALYPDSAGYYLKQALAEKFALEVEQLTLGNGSNDLLELVARAFLTVDDEVIFSQYAFVVYPLVTQAVGAKAVVTPALAWGNDLDAMLAAVTERTRLIFIANPNNPTGTWVSDSALQNFLSQLPEHVLVVLDEAYTEYVEQADFPNGLSLLSRYPNLIVTRTFSKAYGLAGLRVGYAASNTGIADILSRVRQPFNVNSLALAAATAALHDEQHIARSIAVNRAGMLQYIQAFETLGLSYIPSAGNFITVKVGSSDMSAQAVYTQLLYKGVITRPIANYGLPEHLRISVGLADENQRCIQALTEILG